jgi:uncharacterized damage-inducible protein DinB
MKEAVNSVLFRLNENPARIKKCLSLLSEDEVWDSPNTNTNSIGNLILHLNGNIKQYIHESLGGVEFVRQRDLEFSERKTKDKSQLLESIETTLEEACEILSHCSESELKKVRTVQGFELSGIGCAIHVCEHLSYHVGQIALLTKLITNQDLGFYAGMNLNQ